jgi:hypothetical protein
MPLLLLKFSQRSVNLSEASCSNAAPVIFCHWSGRTRGVDSEEAKHIICQHKYSMPTDHPWVEDETITEAGMLQINWGMAKLDTAIAEKRLELFEVGGKDG